MMREEHWHFGDDEKHEATHVRHEGEREDEQE